MVVFSPSNMMTYRTCPMKFYGQTISKELPYVPSAQKDRGTRVHDIIEKAMSKGLDSIYQWPAGLDIDYVRDKVHGVREIVAAGIPIHIEKELVANDLWKPVDWWADDAVIRAKADAILLPDVSTTLPCFIIDIKTGKKWDTDDFQLRVEAYLAIKLFGYDTVKYAYWYVDSGETVAGEVNKVNTFDYDDVVSTMLEMSESISSNYFPPKRNRFCSYCGYNKKECF